MAGEGSLLVVNMDHLSGCELNLNHVHDPEHHLGYLFEQKTTLVAMVSSH